MYTRQNILEATDTTTLLEMIAATPYQQLKTAAGMLSELHNRREFDFLTCCKPSSLAALSDHRYLALQRVFCDTLPQIDCPAEAAVRACNHMSARAGNDGFADLVYSSLSQWFQKNPSRAEEGLALIHCDPDTHRCLVRPVLIAGATHYAKRYVEEAFALSSDAHSPVRLDALWALGQIVSTEDEGLLARTRYLPHGSSISKMTGPVVLSSLSLSGPPSILIGFRCGFSSRMDAINAFAVVVLPVPEGPVRTMAFLDLSRARSLSQLAGGTNLASSFAVPS